MSEKNESVAEVPAEGNSADFFAQSDVASEKKSAKTSWPWAAVAAAAIVAGVGGYAIGQTNGFDTRPSASTNQLDGNHQNGPESNGPGMRGQMGNNDGSLDGSTPHCHVDGQDQAVGTDGKCADGTTPMAPMQGSKMGPGMHGDGTRGIDPDGDNWTGTNKTPTPTTSPSTLTN